MFICSFWLLFKKKLHVTVAHLKSKMGTDRQVNMLSLKIPLTAAALPIGGVKNEITLSLTATKMYVVDCTC